MNKTALRYTGILLAVISLFIACAKSPEEKAVALYQDAMKQLKKFDYDGASKTLDKIAEINSAHPLITAGKGMITEQRMWTVDAFDSYGALIESASNSLEGYLGAYRIQKRMRTFEDALSTANALGSIAPKNPDAIGLLAEAVLNASLPQLANRIIDSAQHIGLAQGQVDFLRARAWFLQKNLDSAHFYAAAALQKRESSTRYYEIAADYYETVGLTDSAMYFSEQAVEAEDWAPVVWISHFDRALRLGYYAAAREVQRKVIAMGADSAVIVGMKADYFNASNRFVEASNEAIHLSSFAPQSCLMRVVHELRARAGMDDAILVTDLLFGADNPLDRAPMSETARQYLISYFFVTYATEATPIDGISFLEKVYGPTMSRRDFRAALTFEYYAAGAFGKFDSLMAFISEHYGEMAEWQASMGTIYMGAGSSHFDQAKEHFEKSLSINPTYAPAFVSYVQAMENLGKFTDVEQLFDRYPYFKTSTPEFAIWYASTLVMNGKRTEAMPIFESAVSLRSGDMKSIHRFLDALTRRFDAEGKEQALAILAKAAPDNPDVIALLSEQALEKKDFSTGLDLAEKGIKTDPDLFVLYALKARGMYAQNQGEEAIKLLDSLYPNNQCDPDFVYQYARLLSLNGINLVRAADLCRGSVMYSNYRMREQLQLIDTYYRMKRYDLSWAEATNISSAFPTRPEGFYREAVAGIELKKPDVKENLERSIALGLGGPELENAKTLLAGLH